MFEIGNSLREARLRQHLEFSAAEQATKIRGKYLRALEDEQFELLPAETYVRGFLRTYAEFLGLDGQLYVDEYNSRFVVGEEEPVPAGRPRRSGVRPLSNRRLEKGAVMAALVGIAVVAALVIAAWRFGAPSHSPTIAGLAKNPPTDSTSNSPAHLQPRSVPARLVLVASRGNCYLQVRLGSATGPQLFQGTLERGQTKRFHGRRLWVSAADPENLSVGVNGHRVQFPRTGPAVLLVTAKGIQQA